MKETPFIDLAKMFSKQVHTKYFPEISPSDWIFNTHFGSNYVFGYQPGMYFNSSSTPPHLIAFNLRFEEGVISLQVVREKEGDKKHYQNIADDFKLMIENSDLNALLFINYNLSSLFNPTSSLPIVAFGEQGKEVLKLIEFFSNDERINFSSWHNMYVRTKAYSNRKAFYVSPVFGNSPHLKLTTARNTKDIHAKLFTAADITSFVDKLEKESAHINEKVVGIVNKVKEIDVTCYYNEENGSLYIFNERVPFHIATIREKGKEKFRVRFGRGYNKGTDLDALMEKVETKLMSYVKKNRLKAAVSGGASDTLSKFLFRIIGHQGNGFVFHKQFNSTLSEGDLNKKLLTIINEPIDDIDEKHCLYYQMYLRSKGDRHQIKAGKKLEDLYTFVSASKLYILTEEEFNALQLNEQKFKQKKDKALVKELNEWKLIVNA